MKATTQSNLSQALPYFLPFFIFALMTYGALWLNVPIAVAYPIKTICVGLCLAFYWKRFRSEIRLGLDWFAVWVGIGVFVLWVGLEGLYPLVGGGATIPAQQIEAYSNMAFVGFRMAGAVLVVPLMEELFWRSFAMRFLIDANFRRVPLGKFTWFSFVAVSVAFGFEHDRWLPGILAGVGYAWVLYRSRNLFAPIVAHGVTNLLLGIYVISTGRWAFW